MPITLLDIILLGVMLISGMLAMIRGFMREILSIASWAAAALLTIYALPRLLPIAKQHIANDYAAMAAVIGGVFIGTLIVVSVITVKISDAILDSRVGALDRTLGFLFGLGRGLIIVVVAFVFFDWLVPAKSQPAWIAQAKSLRVLQNTGQWLMSMSPDLEAIWVRFKKKKEEESEQPPAGTTETPPARRSSRDDQPGYERTDRAGMQQLIDTTAKRR